MRVLVAMSGGVDSSVAAALLAQAGHEVVGATLKLWGGESDTGCCSVADVDDARRVAQQLDIPHYVFEMTSEFDARVVEPYVAAHRGALTPNPCIECNRHIKFGHLVERARRLGFDAIATGHHARVTKGSGRVPHQLRRGTDRDKDQSYVLSMLGQDVLGALVLPVGEMTKPAARARGMELGLRTASKPDSQDVCFIGRAEGRAGFLGRRIEVHPGTLVEARSGAVLGTVDAVELVTVGQRRGIPLAPDGAKRYVASVDARSRTVMVGTQAQVATTRVDLRATSVSWVGAPVPDGGRTLAQMSAHGRPSHCHISFCEETLVLGFDEAVRPVAPGQTVALYDAQDPDQVVGGGIAT
ncbi:MAG: tRNA 2-thiouridine(34) synthase MnmA [Acidimicrobiales bacterium]